MRAEARHNLKHDKFAEGFAETAAETLSWATEHTRNLIIGGAIAIVVLAALIGGWFWMQNQEQKANMAFGHAMRVYETQLRPAGTAPMPGIESFSSSAERAQAARREFAAIADKYPHTDVGKLSKYFMAITFKDEGNFSAAEKGLKDVASTGNKDVAGLAKYALASVYEVEARNVDAINIFKDLIDHPTNTVAKSTAQIELADLYEKIQQPTEAVKVYEQIKKDDPKSPQAQYADSKLAALKK